MITVFQFERYLFPQDRILSPEHNTLEPRKRCQMSQTLEVGKRNIGSKTPSARYSLDNLQLWCRDDMTNRLAATDGFGSVV